jgi:hypothetical protein
VSTLHPTRHLYYTKEFVDQPQYIYSRSHDTKEMTPQLYLFLATNVSAILCGNKFCLWTPNETWKNGGVTAVYYLFFFFIAAPEI